ncbi:dUTP diphosphatase [Arachnia propionica]|uniref:dUTP diphosphatase n=1 Tax=Arachnia propionica TaxID=1750 RepID=UPI003C70283F
MPEIPVVVDALEYLPGYARPGDAGADLRITESVTLQPGERRLVGTGVRIALPAGTFGMVTPRSGQAAKRGLGIVNSPGIIDSGYRGEIRICLINLDTKTAVDLQEGERVAQLVVVPFISAQFIPVAEIDETERGRGGYGSTGQQ